MALRCLPSYLVFGSNNIQIDIAKYLLFALVRIDVEHILKVKLVQDQQIDGSTGCWAMVRTVFPQVTKLVTTPVQMTRLPNGRPQLDSVL